MKKSNAWPLIVISFALLVLLVVTGMSLLGDESTGSTNQLPVGVVLSVALAASALGTAIAANASAYLNHASTVATRIISPFLLALVCIVVAPYFISLGLAFLR